MASGGSGDKIDKLPKAMGGKRSKKSDKDRHHFLLPRRHLSRSSAVRPFFCCGSQVSLNSIPDLKDFPLDRDKAPDDGFEDLTDSDEHGEEHETVQLNTTFTVENISNIDQNYKRGLRISGSKHKKAAAISDKTTRKKFWTLKLCGKLQVSKQSSHSSEVDLSSSRSSSELCVCTSYKAASASVDASQGAGRVPEPGPSSTVTFPVSLIAHVVPPPQAYASNLDGASGKSAKDSVQNSRSERLVPFMKLNELYPIDGIDEQRIAQRQREMELGIEVEQDDSDSVKDGSKTKKKALSATGSDAVKSSSASGVIGPYPTYSAMGLLSTQNDSARSSIIQCLDEQQCPSVSLTSIPWASCFPEISQLVSPVVHTQVDYKHYLVPDINKIVNSSFYWGVMDRYEAEKLLENKPEGTFLLRDSAQDEFLFSVSFRRYGRSLHARIEQWNHKFSFDSRDPGVFATDTVCGLIAHYFNPSSCMFFEPLLTRPLPRTFPFSLQHLSRAAICSKITYDSINKLVLPKTLKEYLRFYHYKQKVRVRRFDNLA